MVLTSDFLFSPPLLSGIAMLSFSDLAVFNGVFVLFFLDFSVSSQLAKRRNSALRTIERCRIMDFNEFKYKISNLKNLKLPGEEAQYKLAPILRIKELGNIEIPTRKPNKAGVMAVFYPDRSEKTNFVLILRKTYQGVHSNQIGFPGGRLEIFDKSLKHTALRETEEEVGIPKAEVEVLKKLTKLYIPPSNFWVHPYIGLVEKTPIFVPQETEVEKILEVNIDEFLDDRNLIKQKLSTSYANNIEVPAFSLNGQVVWGATAMMLSELKELLKEVL